MSYRSKLSYLSIPAILAFSAPAFSQDAEQCGSDADCAEGYTCEKGMYTNGCDPDAGPCDDSVYEEEFGSCVKAPVTCETDADCGEYLACVEGDMGGSCWESSDGTSGCTEPDPDAPMYCAPAFSACETDADCPRSFECLSGGDCPAVDCAEGESCDVPACEPSGGECVPQEIECDADSDCPADWSCFTWTETSCSGGGSDGGGVGGSTGDSGGEPDVGADPLPEPGPVPVEIPEETCVETQRGGVCQPNAWEGYFYGDAEDGSASDSGGEGLNTGDPREEADGDSAGSGDSGGDVSSESGGGCSVGAQGGSSPSPIGLLFLIGAPLVAFRRRLFAQS